MKNDKNNSSLKPLWNAVNFVTHQTLPDGIGLLTVGCTDYADFVMAPPALRFEGKVYGRSGWNSDKCESYYRTDCHVAYAVEV